MARVKISFLFVVGVCLVIIAASRSYYRNSDILKHQNKSISLTWDGSQIIVINNKYISEQNITKNTLPPDLCPIFFQPIPLNYADTELLVTLPGIGPVTAELILQKRLELGRIISSDQLMSIKGIGEKTAKKIEQYTTYDL